MSNKTFDFLRFLAESGFGLIATAWGIIAEAWGIPHGAAVGATIGAIGAVFGGYISWKRKQYNAPEEPETVMIPENYEEGEEE